MSEFKGGFFLAIYDNFEKSCVYHKKATLYVVEVTVAIHVPCWECTSLNLSYLKKA